MTKQIQRARELDYLPFKLSILANLHESLDYGHALYIQKLRTSPFFSLFMGSGT